MRLTRFLLAFVALAAFLDDAALASPQTIYINPAASTNGNGSLANPYNTWSGMTLVAGNTYLQFSGTTYYGVVYDLTTASAASPITIGVYPTSNTAPPIIEVMDFSSGASYATISGFQVTGQTDTAAILIQGGGSHITVTGNIITNPVAGGIYVKGAGPSNIISYNKISNSPGDGISMLATDVTTTAMTTQVVYNTVTGSGCDGIRVEGNYLMIGYNFVSGNGAGGSGCSGIHTYNPGSMSGAAGSHNTITGNSSFGNVDAAAQDGNGIELDQYTTANIVTENLAVQNDGGGIVLYDAPGNAVTYNILLSNSEDRHMTHTFHAELIVNESSAMMSVNNTFSENSMIGYLSNVNAIYLDRSTGNNSFSGDTLAVCGSWPIYDVNGTTGSNQTTWNTTLGATDTFGPPPLTAPTGGPYDYTFPAGTTLPISGDTITLYGWNPSPGLYGTE